MGVVHGSIFDPILRHIFRAEMGKSLFFAPLAPDDDWFKTAVNPTGTSGGETIEVTSFTKAYCPGVPVCPRIEFVETSGSDVTAVSATVKGVDQFGDTLDEEVDLSFVSGTGWVAETSNAFEKLLKVTVVVTGTTDSADTLKIGFDAKYGLGCKINASGDVVTSIFDGAADAGSISVEYSTYDVAGTPDAAKFLSIWVRPGFYFHI